MARMKKSVSRGRASAPAVSQVPLAEAIAAALPPAQRADVRPIREGVQVGAWSDAMLEGEVQKFLTGDKENRNAASRIADAYLRGNVTVQQMNRVYQLHANDDGAGNFLAALKMAFIRLQPDGKTYRTLGLGTGTNKGILVEKIAKRKDSTKSKKTMQTVLEGIAKWCRREKMTSEMLTSFSKAASVMFAGLIAEAEAAEKAETK